MKPFEKIFVIISALIVVVSYSLAKVMFEMTTEDFSFRHLVIIYIVILFPMGYFVIKNIGPKKIQGYIYTLMFSLLALLLTVATVNNIRLLYYGVTGNTTTTTINIENLARDLSKGSLVGSKINVWYNGRHIRLNSSRTNYFALLNKKNFKADIGQAGDNQYYITKVYWQAGELSRARGAFWRYWYQRNWFTPIIIMCVGLLLWFAVHTGERDHPYDDTRPKTPIIIIINIVVKIIKIMGMVFAVLLPLYLIALLIIYSQYGHF